MNKYLRLTISIGVCLLAGGFGSIFTIPSISTWYVTLVKPSFNPPNYIFGPVWTVLYILMGSSFAIVWSKGVKTKKAREALMFFGTQLFLNAIWSPIFFGAKDLLFSFIVISLMWILVLKTILAFGKIDRMASYLLYPYIIWVSFASVLNFSVWILNK